MRAYTARAHQQDYAQRMVRMTCSRWCMAGHVLYLQRCLQECERRTSAPATKHSVYSASSNSGEVPMKMDDTSFLSRPQSNCRLSMRSISSTSAWSPSCLHDRPLHDLGTGLEPAGPHLRCSLSLRSIGPLPVSLMGVNVRCGTRMTWTQVCLGVGPRRLSNDTANRPTSRDSRELNAYTTWPPWPMSSSSALLSCPRTMTLAEGWDGTGSHLPLGKR